MLATTIDRLRIGTWAYLTQHCLHLSYRYVTEKHDPCALSPLLKPRASARSHTHAHTHIHTQTHIHTCWEPRDKNRARKAVERTILRNCRASSDVLITVW